MTRELSNRRITSYGFTLMEALVALGILLVGVYAVIRIFPIGFAAVGYTRSVQVATRLAEQELERVQADPANLPSGILATAADGTVLLYDPDDMVYNAASWSTGSITSFDDADPAQVTGSGTGWLGAGGNVLPGCLLKLGGREERYFIVSVDSDTQLTVDRHYDGTGSYSGAYTIERPSWEPDALFLPRTVVGETVEIPRRQPPVPGERDVPKHVLTLGPILPLVPQGGGDPRRGPVMVYSTRYWAVDVAGLLGSGEERFQYVLDDTTGVLKFDTVPYDRFFKVDYSYLERGAVGQAMRSVVDEPVTVLANQQSPAAPLPAITGLDQQVVPESERVYRTFDYTTAGVPGQGEFTMTQVDQVLGVVKFSPLDAGTTVMIDYRVADWQIVREDKAVGEDDEGAVQLAVAPLRHASYRNAPRQTQALYVDWPNSHDIVALELDTGKALYGQPHDYVSPVKDEADPDFPDAAGYSGTFGVNYTTGELAFSDVPGGVDRRGRTYRVYYRAVEDWGVRVSKAAGRYYSTATDGARADQIYRVSRRDVAGSATLEEVLLSFPLSERGKSVQVDYTVYWTTQPPERRSGELHTMPHTNQADEGVIALDIKLPKADNLDVGIHKVVGVSLEATAVWAHSGRRSDSKQGVPLEEQVARRGVEAFAAGGR